MVCLFQHPHALIHSLPYRSGEFKPFGLVLALALLSESLFIALSASTVRLCPMARLPMEGHRDLASVPYPPAK